VTLTTNDASMRVKIDFRTLSRLHIVLRTRVHAIQI
jgi:hypothetical protein